MQPARVGEARGKWVPTPHQGSKEGGGRKELPPLISPGASQTNPLITVPFPTFGLFAVEVIIVKLWT